MVSYTEDISNFVETNLIAYIGNKRRLIKLIYSAIKKCNFDFENEQITFLDLFAGTGVVSRLAKALGLRVVSNDWEYYSYIINKLYIETNPKELENIFDGNFEQIVNSLNMLKSPKEEYIAKYYCPEDDNNPNPDKERMFYSRENGLIIDAVREKIEELYPDKDKKSQRAKNILIALLLYEAATRANTSGVFKGFHRGFGGSGKDALTRILKRVQINIPTLFKSKFKNRVYRKDAMELVNKLKKVTFDIAYLDPPYNQHQYGSNYHLLNTIALNDKPKINKSIIINGKKINKSAIRKDWVKTRSPYCYKDQAEKEFKELIDTINAKRILVSYSVDGIINFESMLNILSKKGKLDIVCSEYTKYRGGKQALTTKVRNVEFVLIVDTTKKSKQEDIEKVREKLLEEKIENVLKKTFNVDRAVTLGWKVEQGKFYNRMKKNFGSIKADICLKNGYTYEKAEFRCKNNVSTISIIDRLPFDIKEEIFNDFTEITNITKDIEISIFLKRIKELALIKKYSDIPPIFKKVTHLLKKFNNRKAYYKGLKVIIRTLDTIVDVGIEKLIVDKKFKSSLNKLFKIIENKLSVKRVDKSKIDEINFLKTRIKKKLIPVIKCQTKYSGVSNM